MPRILRVSAISAIAAFGALAAAGCSDDNSTNNNPPLTFRETPLVADATGGAPTVDAHLLNPWGIAINQSNGFIWVANNHSGTSTVYQPDGTIVSLVVDIPSATSPTGGEPTGLIFNSTIDFVIPGSGSAVFLFAGEDGVISGWNQSTGTAAVVVADRSGSDASYTGLAAIGNVLFAANFKHNAVDMFDKDFAFVKSFTDPGIPADYGPFNVQSIGTNLYVAYAKVDPATGDEVAGAGNGYVSVFTSDGTFVKRFASNGTLNAPWAIAVAPSNFGSFTGSILVGNFGDGRINVFNSADGTFLGQLKSTSGELELEGLWALATGLNGTLYFAAGIGDEEHGLVGTVGPQ